MNRKILNTLNKAKDTLKQTIKQKISEQEKASYGKTLQSIWNKQNDNMNEGMKKAKSSMQDLKSKINIQIPSDLLKGAKQMNLRDKISKLTKTTSQKSQKIEDQSQNSSIQKLKKNASGLLQKVKSLGKESTSEQNSSQEQNQANQKQRAISRVQDKSKDNKKEDQFFVAFLKAKAREIDSKLSKISTEMKEANFTKKLSFFQILKRFIINFYWRFIVLAFFIAFAYGFGSNLPRQIRIAMQGKEEKQPQKL